MFESPSRSKELVLEPTNCDGLDFRLIHCSIIHCLLCSVLGLILFSGKRKDLPSVDHTWIVSYSYDCFSIRPLHILLLLSLKSTIRTA